MPHPRPFEPKPERINTGIRLTVALYQRLKVAARQRLVSVNQLTEWIIGEWLDKH